MISKTIQYYLSSSPVFWWGPCCCFFLLFFIVFSVVLLCVLTFWVSSCGVRYGLHIKTMFGSYWSSVICKRDHVLSTLFVLFSYSGVQHKLCSVFVFFVLCTLCCQFLWIVHFWLPLRYSLTFICPVSCVPYVASFSGLSIFDCLFGIL